MVNEDIGFDIRNELSSEQRTAEMSMYIDPGFVNHRLVETVLPEGSVDFLKRQIAALPPAPEGLMKGHIDHVFTRVMLAFCHALKVPGLGDLLATGRGRLFSSIIDIEPTPGVYDEDRVVTKVLTPGVEDWVVELHYGTDNIGADTTRMNLANGDTMGVIAKFHKREGNVLQFYPLVMGGPWLEPLPGGVDALGGAEWYSYDFFEVFVEDIEQFAKVKETPAPADFSVMAEISEQAFKQCLVEILGDEAKKDWGGERSDHFAAHVALNGRPTTAAFLLKGPAKFQPMGLNHLGKNNDQIYRLAHEPAGLLVVQHCHEILPAVRATLRAFAVQPGQARYYCHIDGRDSLRLLQAYDKVDRAIELSKA